MSKKYKQGDVAVITSEPTGALVQYLHLGIGNTVTVLGNTSYDGESGGLYLISVKGFTEGHNSLGENAILYDIAKTYPENSCWFVYEDLLDNCSELQIDSKEPKVGTMTVTKTGLEVGSLVVIRNDLVNNKEYDGCLYLNFMKQNEPTRIMSFYDYDDNDQKVESKTIFQLKTGLGESIYTYSLSMVDWEATNKAQENDSFKTDWEQFKNDWETLMSVNDEVKGFIGGKIAPVAKDDHFIDVLSYAVNSESSAMVETVIAKELESYCEKHGLGSTDNDPVTHPSHYTSGGIETLDFIKAKLSPEEFKGYIKGNVMKYITREAQKNGEEDMNKALFYLQWRKDHLESENK